MIDRRTLLKLLVASYAARLLSRVPAISAAPGLELGERQAFSYTALKSRAQALAAQPYVPPPMPAKEITSQIDYATHGQITFRIEDALWAHGPGNFPVCFFHLGKFFQKAVKIHAVSRGE